MKSESETNKTKQTLAISKTKEFNQQQKNQQKI